MEAFATVRVRETERERVLSPAGRERALISIVLALRARAQFSSNRPLVITTVLLSGSPCYFAKLYKVSLEGAKCADVPLYGSAFLGRIFGPSARKNIRMEFLRI